MKLKNKLKMFEEFTSAEKNVETTIDSKGSVTTPSNVTSILGDVDNILGNLETLSKQIDENIDESIDSLTNDFLNNSLNEASAGEMMMQMFKDMGAMAKLGSSYKKMAATKASIDTEKKIFALKFAEEKPEKEAKALEKVKDKLNDAIKAEKDPAKKQRLRAMRDKKLETLKAQISAKIDREKQDQDKKFDRDSADAQSAITKLTGDNKISSPIMSARWDAMKLGIDREIEDANIKAEREAWDKFIDDEERLKRLEDAQLERSKKEAAEDNKRLEQSKADAEEAQAELEEKIANAQGDEKDALDKLKEWNDAYLDLSSKMNLTSDSSDEEKTAASDASTRFNKADEALSKKTMKDAFGYDNELEAEQALLDFNERAQELSDQYKAAKAEAGIKSSEGDPEPEPTPEPDPADGGRDDGGDDDLTDDQRRRIQKEVNQRDTRQAKLDAELAKPESERNQQMIQGLQTGIAKNNQDIEAIRNETPNESVSTSEFDKAITESAAFKSGSVADRFRRLL